MAKSTKTPKPEPAETPAVAAAPVGRKGKAMPSSKRAARPAEAALEPIALAVARPGHDHPNLGLAPSNMSAGFPAAAARLRRETVSIAEKALEAAVAQDRTIKSRYDETGLRRLLRDAQLIVERLGMCVGSDDPRWLVGYAEWIAPIYRRRGVSLLDLTAICDGIRASAGVKDLGDGERASAERALDAATAILKRNSRIAGDLHKRKALWNWMYRGV